MATKPGIRANHPDIKELGQVFFEQTSDGIFIANSEGILLEVNQQLCDMLGYSRDEILNISMNHIIFEEDMVPFSPLSDSFHQQSKQPVLCQMRGSEGNLQAIDLKIQTLTEGYILGLICEARKHNRIEHQFLEKDERFKLLTESSLAGVYLIQNGLFHYVNKAFANMFGYEVREILNEVSMKDLIYPEDHQLVVENIRRRIEGDEDSIRYNFRGLHKNGSILYVDVHGRRVQYCGKAGVIGTLVDISEAKKAEQDLRRLNDELETRIEERTIELKKSYRELKLAHTSLLQQEKMASIGQLAAGIAHEINTPIQFVGDNIIFLRESLEELLAGMQSCQHIALSINDNSKVNDIKKDIETLLEDTDFDYLKEELPLAFKSTLDGLNHISSIVTAMKEFSHPSGDKLQPVDLENLINTTVKISSNSWKVLASLVIEHDTTPLIVEGLRDELGQVLLNLIANAADAISVAKQEDEGAGSILIKTRILEGKWAEIAVKDSGSGISPELQRKIFEPFFTTKEVGRGSGQGLAIAYHIIKDKHGGEILVDSIPGKGSTFTVRLPISK